MAYGNSVYLITFEEYNNLNNEHKITVEVNIN